MVGRKQGDPDQARMKAEIGEKFTARDEATGARFVNV